MGTFIEFGSFLDGMFMFILPRAGELILAPKVSRVKKKGGIH